MQNRALLSLSAGAVSTALLFSVATTGVAQAAEAPTSTQSVNVTKAASSEAGTKAALHTPRLEGADNFRDLAGTRAAIATKDGGHLASGVVYRSNALANLTDADLSTLEGLGVSTVIDLRSAEEIEAAPDRVPAGAEWVNVDIMGRGDTAVNPGEDFHVESPEQAGELLEQANVAFVEDGGQREAFAEVLETVADAEGAVVFHCTAGKDRAGWTAAMLQYIGGADDKAVMKNYLATNDYSAESIDATVEHIRESQGDEAAEAYRVLLGVDADFLQAGLDSIEENYGDVDTYLTEGLGLDQETIEKLQDKLSA